MKKNKLITGMLVALSVLCLAGCGDDKKVISGDVDNKTPQSSENSQGGTNATSEKGYVFKSKNVTISIDGDMAPVVTALGEPASYFEAASCAFEGLDKIYTYNGFVVETYPKDGKDLVSSIVIKDDSVKTPEGITIGSSKDEMVKAYGDYRVETGMCVYKKDGMLLCFLLKNDSVSSIQYKSTVLSE